MRSCLPGKKKFANRVKACNGEVKCIRFGDKSKTIKKHILSRKRSFCARHKCSEKTEPATAGYQSCKKWNCEIGSCKKNTISRKPPRKQTRKTIKERRISSRKETRKPKTKENQQLRIAKRRNTRRSNNKRHGVRVG